MSRERVRLALDIFREACDLPDLERRAFVTMRCGADEMLRREVEAMLASDAAADDDDDPAPAAMREVLSQLAEHAGLDEVLPQGLAGYRVVRRIASGGMGDVFEAEQQNPRRRVAVKIARGSQQSSELSRRFELEVNLLARLQHPHIAQIIEAGTLGGAAGTAPFFVMEFVEGQDLRRFARERLDSVGATIDLVATICDAVAFAHELGVVHRDLKPENVLITADGQPKVLDFGVAKVEAAGGFGAETLRTEAGRVLGTLGYMAPEQLAGAREVGPAADVYALGVVLFELLSNRLPHDLSGVTLSEALALMSAADAPLLGVLVPQFRGDLEAIVARALEKDARHRYANARELQRDLERFRRGETVVARVAGPMRRLAKWGQRNRALATAVIGLFLVLAVATVLLSVANRSARTALDDYARLKDARLLEQAIVRADVVHGSTAEGGALAVWPTRPGQVEGLERWLTEFGPLLGRLDDHRAALRRIAASTGTRDGDRVMFADPAVQWQYDELTKLVADLELFGADQRTRRPAADPSDEAARRASALHCLVHRVEQRLWLAKNIVRLTVTERAGDWAAVAARVVDHPRYAGLTLAPQVGLVPLGPDPQSGLEEFLLFESQAGVVPRPEHPAQRLPVAGEGARRTLGYRTSPPEATGIVFVLVPGLVGGQVFWVGSQSEDPAAPNFDSQCPNGPAGDVDPVEPYLQVTALEPYFLSKYEMTNEQWGRLTGEYTGIGANFPRRPVVAVEWRQCDALMQRLGLALPSEVQWEHAVRAGTDSPWWTGADEQSLAGFENVLERTGAAIYPQGARKTGERIADFTDEVKARDGYARQGTLPVGSYQPNPLGLHDMAGNVSEWCAAGPREVGTAARVVRGGNFMRGSTAARSAWRKEASLDRFALYELGLRPAMPVQPAPGH